MTRLRLGLEWFTNPDHAPLLLAQDRGWFQDAGLEVELIEPEAHLDAVEAIERGDMDCAVTEPLHLVEDRAKGEMCVGFARFLHTNGGVMAKGSIARPRDMAGKRIQYPGAPGPGGPAIVATMVEADGGPSGTEDGYGRVNNSFYHTDALAEDKADVATLVFHNFEIVEARQRGMDVNLFALKDWGVPDFCQLVLITHPDKLAAERETFQKLVAVLRRGVDAVKQEPDAAREAYFRLTESDPEDALTRAIYDATVPCFTHDFSMSTDYYARLEAWMAERGLIDATPGADVYWTNDLAL
ncbi:ABC transporter substrate-binding protein [Rubrivirga sp. IMCC43871]|uniref:ABC transporter substrate-binding protein n=1 Tax=Rubrivirga sp. IMCC43871 TaxID=3391575 RepID=UPI00398FA759